MHPSLEPNPIMAFVDPASADDIYVERGWRPEVGQPVPSCPDIFIGEKFGAGALSMNTIYDLVDRDGNSVGEALKVCKSTRAARRSLAHEWKMFKNLALLGEKHPAARSHVLQAHRVLKLNDDSIVGIIMEKANGKNAVKPLKDPNFSNVRYVIALLRDLLVSLDVAQRVLGFAHYDLKLDNVMEHWSCSPDPEGSRKRVMLDGIPQFKLFDFGTAVVYPDPFSVKEVPDADNLADPEGQRPEAAGHLKREKKYGNTDKPGVITHSAKEPLFEFSQPYCCVRIYHMYWKQRGDMYRVLHALCRLLDNRTWPVEDLELVSLLFTVLEHCTNSRRLKAHFVPRAFLLRKLGLTDKPQPANKYSNSSNTGQHMQQKTAALQQQHHAGAVTAAPAGAPGAIQLTDNANHGVSHIRVPPGAAVNTSTDGPLTPRRSSVEVGTANQPQSVPGVAYVRLSPPPSPMAGADGRHMTYNNREEAVPIAAGAADQCSTGHCDRAAKQPAAARAAAVSDEGCRVDPAAYVVEEQPVAPTSVQSVFGSRKALKGVTAQQLLAEPVVQSLLRKLNE